MFFVDDDIEISYQGNVKGLLPRIISIETSAETNLITVKVIAKRVENYEYYIGENEGDYEKKETNKTGEYTFTNLTQNKIYNIKVIAKNNNGDDIEEKIEYTGNVIIANGNLNISEVTWNTSTHKASVTITKESNVEDNLKVQYQVNGDKEDKWIEGEVVDNLNHNDIVYARLWNGAKGGEYITSKVTDNLEPTVTVYVGNVVNKTITITANGKDNQSGIASYEFYINGELADKQDISNEAATYKYTSNFGVITGYVILTDNAGNTKQSEMINIEDYTIATKSELEKFRDSVNNGNNYYNKTIIQTADINLQGSETNQWTPIGDINTNRYFNGTYDGKNHTISGIYINNTSSQYQALFTQLNGNGTIKNLTTSGSISNVQSDMIAGIVGSNTGNIINCINDIAVTGINRVGGISAINHESGTISQCINRGTLTVNASQGLNEDQGGVVAMNNGTIKQCINEANIINNAMGYDVGGIAGQNAMGTAIIEDCYNIGEIKGANIQRIGGIVGWTWGATIKNCYNVGNVTGQASYGGVVGDNISKYTGTVTNTYYLSGVCSTGIGNGQDTGEATEKTSEQLKGLAGTLGSSFKTDSSNINRGYPILSWQ